MHLGDSSRSPVGASVGGWDCSWKPHGVVDMGSFAGQTSRHELPSQQSPQCRRLIFESGISRALACFPMNRGRQSHHPCLAVWHRKLITRQDYYIPLYRAIGYHNAAATAVCFGGRKLLSSAFPSTLIDYGPRDGSSEHVPPALCA